MNVKIYVNVYALKMLATKKLDYLLICVNFPFQIQSTLIVLIVVQSFNHISIHILSNSPGIQLKHYAIFSSDLGNSFSKTTTCSRTGDWSSHGYVKQCSQECHYIFERISHV
jgi:hypothetical protein